MESVSVSTKVSTQEYSLAAEIRSWSHPVRFTLGTGSQLLTSTILPACLKANHEVIIVTCFWAESKSRDNVSQMLRQLSERALALRKRSPNPDRNIRVRLCLSSVCIVQKLLQTSHTNGMVYLPDKWANIGLPEPRELKGLDMVVKSIFIKPFSVMHPKFILIDRERVFMPSCNVSSENWFEGCVEMRGPIAVELFNFWNGFWGKEGGGSEVHKLLTEGFQETPIATSEKLLCDALDPIGGVSFDDLPRRHSTPTTLLPSPHCRRPHFRLFRSPQPRPTALNTFILENIKAAQCSIYVQTPNLTCRPFITAILDALITRGINVTIVTSRKLMWLEQLVTAGTITEIQIWKIRRRYRRSLKRYETMRYMDPEANLMLGKLDIAYYRPRDDGDIDKSHIKLTIFDDEIAVLGSGNQDRASWYTSQELGIAFSSKEVATGVRTCVQEALENRLEQIL